MIRRSAGRRPAGHRARWPLDLALGGVRLSGPRRRRSRCSTARRSDARGGRRAGHPGRARRRRRVDDGCRGRAREVAPGVSVSTPPPRVVVAQGDARPRCSCCPRHRPTSSGCSTRRRTPARAVGRARARRRRRRLTVRSTARPTFGRYEPAAGAFVAVAVTRRSPGWIRDRARAGALGRRRPRDVRRARRPRAAPDADAVEAARLDVVVGCGDPRPAGGCSTSSGRATWRCSRSTDDGRRPLLGRHAVDDRTRRAGPAADAELTLRIVPLHPEAAIHLPAEAEARRRAQDASAHRARRGSPRGLAALARGAGGTLTAGAGLPLAADGDAVRRAVRTPCPQALERVAIGAAERVGCLRRP